jgi:hypothetical protein
MDEIASESVLPQAYTWLCERRREYSPNYDVWNVRRRWEEIRPRLLDQLRAGAYRLGPGRRIHHGDETIEVWSALNALVLKATAIVLAGLVPPHAHADLVLLAPVRSWCRIPNEVRALRPGSDAAGPRGEIGPGSRAVLEAEDVQQRAEPPSGGAGLVQLGGELLDASPIGFAVGVGGRRARPARRLQLGDPIAPGLQLGLESLGSLVRRPDSGLEAG